jgi:tetratricopeptide (TPR) repeat protein
MIPDPVLQELEQLKGDRKFKQALSIVNAYLVKNPNNREALYHVADIEYRMGKLDKSQKPIDYLVASDTKDPMGWYLKGVIAMEKTDRELALTCFKTAHTLEPDIENPELLRCIGLSQYRTNDKDHAFATLMQAHTMNDMDAEILLNLVELHILEKQYSFARTYIDYYFEHLDEMLFLDRDQQYYDNKFAIFDEYIHQLEQSFASKKKSNA